MKKILIPFLAWLLSLSCTIGKYGFRALPVIPLSSSAQDFMFGTNVSDHSAGIYETNSPTNTHGNRRYQVIVNKDEQHYRGRRIYFDTVNRKAIRVSTDIGFMMCNGSTGEVLSTKSDSVLSFLNSNLTIPLSHVTGTASLLTPSTSIVGVGSTSVNGSFPNYTVTSAPSPTNLNQLVNGPGFISGYTPTITIAGSVLGVIGGNTITLPAAPVQSLSISLTSLSISGGNTVTLPIKTYYNLTGTVTSDTKEINAVISPSVANSYTINISAASFTSISSINVSAAKNTTVASSAPIAWIVSYTTSQVVISIVESNTQTQNVILNLLGALGAVLTGPPNIFANITGLTVHLKVTGK